MASPPSFTLIVKASVKSLDLTDPQPPYGLPDWRIGMIPAYLSNMPFIFSAKSSGL
jgi:hypothetical protein